MEVVDFSVKELNCCVKSISRAVNNTKEINRQNESHHQLHRQPFANSIGNAAVSETAQQAIASLDLLRHNDNRERSTRGPRQSGAEKIGSVFDVANDIQSINALLQTLGSYLDNITDIKQLTLAKKVVDFSVKELNCCVKSISRAVNNTKEIKHAAQANAKTHKQKNREAANQMKIAQTAMQKNPYAELSNMLKLTREALKHGHPSSTSAAASKEKTGRPPLAELPRQKKSRIADGSEVVVVSVPRPSGNNTTYTPSEAI
jgi:hypothetical protein